MPKSVECWKEIENNVSLPLTFSYMYDVRCSDLIVTELESWTRSTGSRPSHVIVLCSWENQLTLTIPLPPPGVQIGVVNCQGSLTKAEGGVTPSRGGV